MGVNIHMDKLINVLVSLSYDERSESKKIYFTVIIVWDDYVISTVTYASFMGKRY